MQAKTFPIFDCDSHIVEPPAIWDEYVPRDVRAWAKTQFHFHTDTDVLLINARAVPASRERKVSKHTPRPNPRSRPEMIAPGGMR